MKDAVLYEEAKRFFVDEGVSLDSICKILEGKVSRRTLYNWKQQHNWEEARAKKVETQISLQDDLLRVTRVYIREALENPKATTAFAIGSMITAMKTVGQVKLSPDEEEKVKEISQDTIKKVAAILGVTQ